MQIHIPSKQQTVAQSGGRGALSYRIREFVGKYPNSNGIEIRDAMIKIFPDMRPSQTASILKQLTDSFYLKREEIRVGTQVSFKYEIIPDDLRTTMFQRHKSRLKAKQGRAAKAREALAAKRARMNDDRREKAMAEEANKLEELKMPTVQMPLTAAPIPTFVHTPPVPPLVAMLKPHETGAIQIRLTLTIAGQDIHVTVREAQELHRTLSDFLGV